MRPAAIARTAALLALFITLAIPAAAQQPAPTATLNHYGSNELPGPQLLAFTVSGTTWVTARCEDGTVLISARNPFPNRSARWERVQTTPICGGQPVTITLQGIGNQPDATFGPFVPTAGAVYVRDGTPAAGAAEATVYLPVTR